MQVIKKIVVIIYEGTLKIVISLFSPFLFFVTKLKLKPVKGSLIVLCLAKNNAKQLQKTLKRFSKIQNYFSDFKVLVYENNSTDSTKEILKKAKEHYSFIDYFSFDYSNEELENVATVKIKPSMKQCRIQHIAKGRNFLLQKVRELYSNFSTTLAFDSDVYYFNPFKIVQLYEKFCTHDIDILSVNGLTKAFKYRDAYAFRSSEYPYGPEYLGTIWWSQIVQKIQKRYHSKKVVPVFSAFGGAAFYKTKHYVQSEYSALHTNTSMKMQQKILEEFPESKREDAAPVTSPIENTNYTGPIVCEHVPFHYSLYKQGFKKQFIDTSWRILFL